MKSLRVRQEEKGQTETEMGDEYQFFLIIQRMEQIGTKCRIKRGKAASEEGEISRCRRRRRWSPGETL